MRNDARPMGEQVRDTVDRSRQERGSTLEEEMKKERKPFVTGHDVGDEETPKDVKKPPSRDRTSS
jgi:hypothetical protein